VQLIAIALLLWRLILLPAICRLIHAARLIPGYDRTPAASAYIAVILSLALASPPLSICANAWFDFLLSDLLEQSQ
jgi:hypothetical protein